MPCGQHWRVLALYAVLLFSLVLQGCAARPPAPIEDRTEQPSPAGRLYSVQPEDTLFSIAWRYGLDYPRLAAANNIAPPYTIYVGQRLALREADLAPAASPQQAAPPVSRPARVPARPPTAVSPRQRPAVPAVSSEKGASKSTPAPAARTAPATPKPPLRQPSPPPESTVGAWLWPAQGPVVRGFSSTLHKGIDIAGEEGDPVVAVATGQIVYAGRGIPGYGELLIVRHNARYLSAYGHNDRLLVGEGDSVRAGQKIATRGSSGTNSVKLHFEIRENGKPIDPMGLLPRR